MKLKLISMMKSYNNDTKTDFHDESLPPEQTPYLEYSLILRRM